MVEHSTTAPILTSRFQQAFAFAGELHATQVRKGTNIPCLAHLMSVAALVLEHGGGEDAAIAGLLHDAAEDSADGAAVEKRIRDEFGDHVGDIVMACSGAAAVPGQPKPPWRERKAAYVDCRAAENDSDSLPAAVWDRFSQNDQQASVVLPVTLRLLPRPRPTRLVP